MAEAYCVKCKAKREMKEATQVEINAKGGGKRPALQGICPECDTKMMRILPKSAAA